MSAITCQYGGCIEDVGTEGVVVSLKTATFDGEKHAVFCSAAHAAMSLTKLAIDRKEITDYIPPFYLPRQWRTT